MSSESLLDLFDNMKKRQLLEAILALQEADLLVPLDELLEILDDAEDIEISTLIIETLLIRIDDVDQVLMGAAYANGTDHLRQYIVLILTQAKRSRYMQFLLNEYFYNHHMRAIIRKVSFKDKRNLFVNLIRYFETATLNTDNVATAQQLLKTIPRDVVLSTTNVFSGSKLMDVYYAIPLKDRNN